MKQSNKKRPIKKPSKDQMKASDTVPKDQPANFPPKVERVYKTILRAMSWIVGTALILVIVLFYFNSTKVDHLSQVIFYIGIVTLVLFIVIELVGFKFKTFLNKFIKE